MQQEAQYSFPYHYSDLSEGAYKFANLSYLIRIATVKQMLSPYLGQLVLDAGCGDGRLCYELRNENIKVVGVDMSERAISFARAFNPEIEFFVQNLEDL